MDEIDSMEMKCDYCEVPMKLVEHRYNQLTKRIDDHTVKMIMSMLELLVLYGAMTASERAKIIRRVYRRNRNE